MVTVGFRTRAAPFTQRDLSCLVYALLAHNLPNPPREPTRLVADWLLQPQGPYPVP